MIQQCGILPSSMQWPSLLTAGTSYAPSASGGVCPELTLLGLAAIGGSVGALVAMKLFHHKTLHLKFKYGVPLILALQVAGLVYLHMPR